MCAIWEFEMQIRRSFSDQCDFNSRPHGASFSLYYTAHKHYDVCGLHYGDAYVFVSIQLEEAERESFSLRRPRMERQGNDKVSATETLIAAR